MGQYAVPVNQFYMIDPSDWKCRIQTRPHNRFVFDDLDAAKACYSEWSAKIDYLPDGTVVNTYWVNFVEVLDGQGATVGVWQQGYPDTIWNYFDCFYIYRIVEYSYNATGIFDEEIAYEIAEIDRDYESPVYEGFLRELQDMRDSGKNVRGETLKMNFKEEILEKKDCE